MKQKLLKNINVLFYRKNLRKIWEFLHNFLLFLMRLKIIYTLSSEKVHFSDPFFRKSTRKLVFKFCISFLKYFNFNLKA